MYTCGEFISIFGKTNIVKFKNKIKLKKIFQIINLLNILVSKFVSLLDFKH